MTHYVIAPGDKRHRWVLASTAKLSQQKSKMNFEGDDVLLEFLRGVIARGGRVLIEIPHSASESAERARNTKQPKQANANCNQPE